MAIKKGVAVTLDKPRLMRVTTNALVTTEQLTGLKLMSVDMERVSFTEMRALVFACLWADDNSMTLAMAGDLIDEYGSTITDHVMDAIGAAFPGAKSGNVQTPAEESPSN